MKISHVIQNTYRPQFKAKEKNNPGDNETNKTVKSLLYGVGISSAIITGYSGMQMYNVLNETNNAYVEPAQKDFGTREDALNYAFKKILMPLNKEKPHEYTVIINDKTNEVMAEFNGQEHSSAHMTESMAFYELLGIKTDKHTAIHGHPENEENHTQTLSFPDFESLNKISNRSSIMAITKDGEFFSLRKKENFKPLDKKELQKLEKQYINTYINRKLKTHRYYSSEYGRSIVDYPLMHNFWKSVADRYNLEYETNYCNNDSDDPFDRFFRE